MAELNLPNPGNGRYWDIRSAPDGDALIYLSEKDGKVIATERVLKPILAEDIIEAAGYMIYNAAEFVGQYKFEGE